MTAGQELSQQVASAVDESISKQSALSVQVGGDHYRNLKIQPIEYILANGLGFCEGNVVKYITRYKHKGQAIEDLDKVIHYVELLKESLSEES